MIRVFTPPEREVAGEVESVGLPHLSPRQYHLLRLIADGKFHSGAALARTFGLSRAAVWKDMQQLLALGLCLYAIRGRGYRLAHPLELLDAAAIQRALGSAGRACLHGLEVLPIVDSTNTYLLHHMPQYETVACLAEAQTAGRGRRGRTWVSPFGHNLYLSLRHNFASGMAGLGSLSLVAAIAVKRALTDIGVSGVQLKWPNDVYWAERKLAGILLEARGESLGPCHVVIGVGVNVAMPDTQGRSIGRPWIDLASIHPGVSRNYLSGRLLYHLLNVVHEFQKTGLTPFLSEWAAADLLQGREVSLVRANEVIQGVARGISPEGALVLSVGGTLQHHTSGETTLRQWGELP